MTWATRAGWAAVGVVVAALLLVTAVTTLGPGPRRGLASGPVGEPLGAPAAQPLVAGTGSAPSVAPLRGPLRTADLLVWTDRRSLDLRRLRALDGVAAVEPVGVGSLVVEGRTLTAAVADPSTYRRWSGSATARADGVWDAVARGEVVLAHEAAAGLGAGLGSALPWTSGGALRLGALATTVSGVDVVVGSALGARLGLPLRNGAVVSLEPSVDDSAGRTAAVTAVGAALGRGGGVRDLAASAAAEQAAQLAGGDLAEAVGSFTYQWFEDGTVAPDPAWVEAAIVTEEVPLLGSVTCHRVMVPRLRAALAAVAAAGLADAIDPGDYGGCYVPRFIDRDPSRGLSLHTWGIAVDLNVSGNHLGTVGTIDRRVVAIFERHGFAWGGHWSRPDPMHFELAVL